MYPLKNDLLIKALKGEAIPRPPVWMMRQAGRYLPDYRKLREKFSFFERCQTPGLAAEITLQPVRQIGVDAAIIFSDILVIPQAMGMEVQLIEKIGPFLPNPIKRREDLLKISTPDVKDRLHYVFEAISLTKEALEGSVPLIGFAGAPFTILCYMVQGKGSKTFDEARSFCFQQPETAHQLLQMITKITIEYLKGQVSAGADCIQLFDSWAGLLSPHDFNVFSLPYLKEIVSEIKLSAPVILFAKGCWHGLEEMSRSGANALGLDWCIKPETARQFTNNNVTLQGNLDPAKLLAPVPKIKREVKDMLQAFGKEKYIANLGHGILPDVPVDHARAFVDAVKEFS